MTDPADPFTVLGLPPRPWLDPDALKAAFLERARAAHPDAPGGGAVLFAAVNAAHDALRDPATRLALLAGGAAGPSLLPPDAALGFRIGGVLGHADRTLGQLGSARSAVERALLAGNAREIRRALESVAAEVAELLSATEVNLTALDSRWPDVAGDDLAALAANFRFLNRWRTQLADRLTALDAAR